MLGALEFEELGVLAGVDALGLECAAGFEGVAGRAYVFPVLEG